MKQLIVTADDFGLSLSVNEAIEQAHRKGILTTASLMVGEAAAADAVRRAHCIPTLKVGLHVVVADGYPVLSPDIISDLVDSNGRLPSNLVRAGVRFYCLPRVRKQIESEIRAQFEAFIATGLALDHVNAHHHMHLHPTILRIILKIGREFELRAIRLPYEPASKATILSSFFLKPWLWIMSDQLRQANIFSNDYIFGFHDTGKMTAERVLALISKLPEGVSEIYFHPAVDQPTDYHPLPDQTDRAAELNALTNRDIQNILQSSGIQMISFSDIASLHS
ncbi:hopanoid biosynthesis associated protein HpnK [Candidatus Nitrosoglobus terrae]|uniref:Hopanoid biosynthesis associated protein HpnK n=1 Tax=Candidatus Nitrosoglobus terrae TaxID=1630141 RepID=A0A1Q2SML9_9GAMM|nr:hopanoid biosynthesis-associated protein HpnK [Candidatus Nitrosoglobus terrae]BAW80388.1 hopanoid biosynthesis associated protein HpnK [Candidatus Nitrosoglobus terrae]